MYVYFIAGPSYVFKFETSDDLTMLPFRHDVTRLAPSRSQVSDGARAFILWFFDVRRFQTIGGHHLM